jgi:hypothetical protein
MSNLLNYAEKEMDLIGLTGEDDMNGAMRKHLLHMIKEFSEEGHSGYSASYAISCLKRLLSYKPLSPLTGEDDEWNEVSEISGYTQFQNKRCSSVFKDDKDGEAYDIQGKVFWDWYTDPDTNEKHKSYYTSRDSRVPVTFPYAVPDEPIYEFRESEAE